MVLRARAVLSSVLALSLVVSQAVPAVSAVDALTKADYEACQSRDDGAFRAAVENITQLALKNSLASFDTKAAVAEAWRANGLDETIDKRVDLAVAEISSETSWAELLKSLANSAKAQELAKAVAERVYRSQAIKTGLEAVANDTGKKLGTSLEFASQDAAGPAITCVKTFLGSRYGTAVSSAVTGRAEKEFGIDSTKGKASISPGSVVSQSSEGIAGAAILLVRRQLVNMTERIGARIVGSVLSRLVSVAAGGVGAVLIAKDIWDLRTGVLPIIANEMKSKATKEQVQAELAKSISDQIGDHVKEIASKSAQHIVEIWQDFRRAHLKSLDLADRNEAFRTFLDLTKPVNLPRLDEVVGLVLASEGEPAVTKRLSDGTLDSAVNRMPAPGMDIARETRSVETGLKWTAVSGDLLPKVAELELHRRANPDDYTRVSLGQLMALDDKISIQRLSSLKRDARETLFELDTVELKPLARALSETELGTLSGYLTGLDKRPRERVLRAIASSPGKMRILASARVRDAVLASRDQSSAVDLMLRAGVSSPSDILADARLAFEGQVSPMLIWERHPIAVLSAIIPALILLLLLRRIIMPARRPKPPRGPKPPHGSTPTPA
ncbi:MAG: hypothetical protein ABL901_00635 [Hyphomicrobiaceae bacterium]